MENNISQPLDWSNPNILHQISQEIKDLNSEEKIIAIEILKHNSIEDIIFNWLEGDFTNGKNIEKCVYVWQILSEIGLIQKEGKVKPYPHDTNWMLRYSGDSTSAYLMNEAIPTAIKKLEDLHPGADFSETGQRFRDSMETYYKWLFHKGTK